MKKALICVLLAMICLFAGCGKTASDTSNSTPTLAPVTSAAEWVDVLSATIPFEDQMQTVEGKQAIGRYGADEAYEGDCALYISTMATPEEIAVFKTDGQFDADYFTALASDYLARQKESYSDYAPEQVPKLDSAVVRVCGEYVLVCVSADNEKAASVLDAYIGK